ncbi:MAG TPA: phosphodiesterase [Xanthomonadaceae bacterium]|nr:phosphodiesterase [Xanthomonadaceae bacterium]
MAFPEVPIAAEASLSPDVALPADQRPALTRIAFGSCAEQHKPQPIWDAVAAADPDLFLFLGDNVYGDTRERAELERTYAALGAQPGFQRMRATTAVMATWDDHDYGENDAGAEYPMKVASREVFFDFWREPLDSPRRARDGIYTSATFGPPGQRVQVILLDLRWNRTPIARNTAFPDDARYAVWAEAEAKAGREVPGPYARDPSPAATMLGEAQWAWLADRLREPADLRLIGSSLQVLADFPGWEAWVNYPRDQARLFQLIRDTGAKGVVFLSGDTHYGELTRLDANVPYPLLDLTSSGLTEEWHVRVPNALRVEGPHHVANVGLVDIDWAARRLVLRLRGVDGRDLLSREVDLDALQPR